MINSLRCLILLLLPLVPLNGEIRVELFRGEKILPHFSDMLSLCDAIYREPPYLYNGGVEAYTEHLNSYASSSDAIFCLAFDDNQVIGLAIGQPMSHTRDVYTELFLNDSYPMDQMFYIGEFGVEPSYRGQDLEEALYRQMEDEVALHTHFALIAAWELENTNPEQTLTPFWQKVGFTYHPELNFVLRWTNIGDDSESEHRLVYFIKKIQ